MHNPVFIRAMFQLTKLSQICDFKLNSIVNAALLSLLGSTFIYKCIYIEFSGVAVKLKLVIFDKPNHEKFTHCDLTPHTVVSLVYILLV